MRKLSLCIATAAAFTGLASAQQYFSIHPGLSSFTWRGDVQPTASGELHQGFHKSQVRGLGDNGTDCTVYGVRYAVQDQDGSTPASFNVVFRTGTDATGPGGQTIDIMAAYGPVPFPPSAAGPVAYFFNIGFLTPLTVPCDEFFSAGIEFPAQTSTDFISVHAADSAANAQHALAEDMTWNITYDEFGYTVDNPSVTTTLRMSLVLLDNSFRIGNVVTSGAPFTRFGSGGFFPNNAATGTASQGIGFQCPANAGSLGVAFVFMSIDFGPSTFTVSGFNNRGYLDLGTLFPIAAAIGPSDGTAIPMILPGLDLLPNPGLGARLCFQAVVVHPIPVASNFDFTNAVIMTLN